MTSVLHVLKELSTLQLQIVVHLPLLISSLRLLVLLPQLIDVRGQACLDKLILVQVFDHLLHFPFSLL